MDEQRVDGWIEEGCKDGLVGGWMDGWMERRLRERVDDGCTDGQRDGSHHGHTINTGGCLGSTARLLWGEWARPEQCSESQSIETGNSRQDRAELLWCEQSLLCDPWQDCSLPCALVLQCKNADNHSCPERSGKSL